MGDSRNSSGSGGSNGDFYNRGGMYAFLFAMAFCCAFFFYVVAIVPKIDLGEGLMEVKPATKEEVKLADVSKITEPWVANEDMVAHGRMVYSQNCAICHGPSGKGDGAGGAALNPKPRNLVTGPWKKGGGYIGLFKVLQEGIPGGSMASFKHLKAIDRWALVQFIDSITEAKTKEDLKLVAEFGKSAQ